MAGVLDFRFRRLLGAAYRRLPPGVFRAAAAARGFPSPLLIDRPAGRRVIAVAPHPDDELIGCGGTLVKHLDAGEATGVVLMTSGEATEGLAHLPAAERAPHREAEAAKAMATLGVPEDRLWYMRAPDTGVEDDAGVLDRLSEVLADFKPDLIYTPWPVDANRDHRATAEVIAAAIDRLDGPPPLLALYEVWTPLTPTHVVDVTEAMDRKLAALQHYECALASIDFVHTAPGLAAYRSAFCLGGRGFAEAFCILDHRAYRSLLELL